MSAPHVTVLVRGEWRLRLITTPICGLPPEQELRVTCNIGDMAAGGRVRKLWKL